MVSTSAIVPAVESLVSAFSVPTTGIETRTRNEEDGDLVATYSKSTIVQVQVFDRIPMNNVWDKFCGFEFVCHLKPRKDGSNLNRRTSMENMYSMQYDHNNLNSKILLTLVYFVYI